LGHDVIVADISSGGDRWGLSASSSRLVVAQRSSMRGQTADVGNIHVGKIIVGRARKMIIHHQQDARGTASMPEEGRSVRGWGRGVA
jgi:hypothetical protein